jgi:hypothetical protein
MEQVIKLKAYGNSKEPLTKQLITSIETYLNSGKETEKELALCNLNNLMKKNQSIQNSAPFYNSFLMQVLGCIYVKSGESILEKDTSKLIFKPYTQERQKKEYDAFETLLCKLLKNWYNDKIINYQDKIYQNTLLILAIKKGYYKLALDIVEKCTELDVNLRNTDEKLSAIYFLAVRMGATEYKNIYQIQLKLFNSLYKKTKKKNNECLGMDLKYFLNYKQEDKLNRALFCMHYKDTDFPNFTTFETTFDTKNIAILVKYTELIKFIKKGKKENFRQAYKEYSKKFYERNKTLYKEEDYKDSEDNSMKFFHQVNNNNNNKPEFQQQKPEFFSFYTIRQFLSEKGIEYLQEKIKLFKVQSSPTCTSYNITDEALACEKNDDYHKNPNFSPKKKPKNINLSKVIEPTCLIL